MFLLLMHKLNHVLGEKKQFAVFVFFHRLQKKNDILHDYVYLKNHFDIRSSKYDEQ